ncbi:hypothetical protein Tco_0620900, partial [Tanacetum coccineum]
GTIPTTILDTTPVITPPITQTDTIVIPTEIPITSPTIPPSPYYTPASPDYSPAFEIESDPFENPSSDHIPPLPAISPFLSSADDTTDSDTPDTPPSPTHGTPFTEITSSTQRSPVIPHRRVMILAPGQPIPHGRPYRYHPNGPVHMMTARKRVGPLPVQQLAVRHSVDHSSSDYFSLDDSARDSSSDSSSEASSDFHSDASSDSSSRHLLSDHSSPDLPSTSAGPSRKRRRSPMTYVPALPPVSGVLSLVHADLIPSSKRIRDSGYLADVEVDPRETSLRDDVIVRGSDEPHLEQDIDPEIQAEIDECFAYADALMDRRIDARVVVKAVDRVESETGKMELENSQNNALAKLPMLKLGEYEMWEIRIKQYFQIQDYALWEVIENGNSWVPIPVTAPESGPSTALKMTVPSTTEEKICKKNDVKARSLLLMALPNEHQLTFNQYVDA